MLGQCSGYVRVSTPNQHTERQLEGVEVAKTFTDKASGKDTKRPQLEAHQGFVRDGDTDLVPAGYEIASSSVSLPSFPSRDYNMR